MDYYVQWIEKAAITIKSESGYTPLIYLENGFKREWKTFVGLLGVTEQEIKQWIYQTIQKMDPPYRFWKTAKGFVDECGLFEWMVEHMRSAATIEDILMENGTSCICCSGENEILAQKCKTTNEFDEWIKKVKSLGVVGRVTIDIPFYGNQFCVPGKNTVQYPCIISAGKDGYLANFSPDYNSIGFCKDPRKALRVEQAEDMPDLMRLNKAFYGKEFFQNGRRVLKPQSAAIQSAPFDTIIQVTGTKGLSVYYLDRQGRKMCLTSSPECATRFPNHAAAEKFIREWSEKPRFQTWVLTSVPAPKKK